MNEADKKSELLPLVSVIVASYNQTHFIHDTLQSVLDQDYDNFEIIVADDGSTDGTDKIILDYASRYPGKIVPLVDGPNLGITRNCNRGLKPCRGKYIAFLGGDDLMLPHKIRKQVEWLECDENRVLCYHDMDVFDSLTGKTIYLQSDKYRYYTGKTDVLVRYGTFFGATTVMIRSAVNNTVYFDERIPVASDWLYFIDIVESSKGAIGYIEGVYARYRRHSNNITSVGTHARFDTLTTLDIVAQKYPHYLSEVKQRRSFFFLTAAYSAAKKKDYLSAFSFMIKSFIACRGRWTLSILMVIRKILGMKI